MIWSWSKTNFHNVYWRVVCTSWGTKDNYSWNCISRLLEVIRLKNLFVSKIWTYDIESPVIGEFWAIGIPARSGIFATLSCGFDMDSKYNTFVDGVMAFCTELKSSTSTKVVVTLLDRGRKWARNACVPPYRRFDATMWSPELHSCIKTAAIADIPLAVQYAASVPSIAAIWRDRLSTVGL